MTKKKLVDFITKKAGVRGHLIDEVKVYELFSFITVPFNEAEVILKSFKKGSRGQKPLVVKAKKGKK